MGSLISTRIDARSVKPQEKTADPLYRSPEYRHWRAIVIARAGRRCEDIDERTGLRCTKAEPAHRMFADHVIEVSDGGAKFDPANGMCRCGSHHTSKTMSERAKRLAAPIPPGGGSKKLDRRG